MSQKFCHIFVWASLQNVYHVIKAVQAVVGLCNDWLYCSGGGDGRCANRLCIVSFIMQYECDTDECALWSNLGTHALQVETFIV